jgi:hypothetical protein
VGNFRHRLLGAHEDFFRRRVVALVAQHVINLLALGRQTQTGGTQLFGQVLFVLVLAARLHYGKFTGRKVQVKI